MIIIVLTREAVAKGLYRDADLHVGKQPADGWMDEWMDEDIDK